MLQFTIPQLREVMTLRYNLSKDRFVSYAMPMFGLTEKAATEEWKKLFDLQRILVVAKQENISDEEIEQVLVHAFEINEMISSQGHIEIGRVLPGNREEEKKLVYYSEPDSEEIKQLKVNINYSPDIIAYARLLERECTVRAALDFVENVKIDCNWNNHESDNMDIYEGDIISSMDSGSSFFGNNSGVYLCEGKHNGYSRLLYTYGRGYIRNGEPDREEESCYSDHVFNSYDRKFIKIGNIHLDASVLVENPKKKNK